MNKLNDAEGEAAETQTWLQFAVECGYVEAESTALYSAYDAIVAMLVNMQNHSDDWVITKRQEKRP